MKCVSNASPLIFLAKLDILGLLKDDIIIIPSAVEQELFAKESAEKDKLNFFCQQKNILRQSPKHLAESTKALHPGEQAAINLALEKNINTVFLDDRRARVLAKLKKLSPKGTLWIITRALEQGGINKKTAKNLLYDLPKVGFRIDERILLEAIKTVDNF